MKEGEGLRRREIEKRSKKYPVSGKTRYVYEEERGRRADTFAVGEELPVEAKADSRFLARERLRVRFAI